jgi:hypothetical protein
MSVRAKVVTIVAVVVVAAIGLAAYVLASSNGPCSPPGDGRLCVEVSD